MDHSLQQVWYQPCMEIWVCPPLCIRCVQRILLVRLASKWCQPNHLRCLCNRSSPGLVPQLRNLYYQSGNWLTCNTICTFLTQWILMALFVKWKGAWNGISCIWSLILYCYDVIVNDIRVGNFEDLVWLYEWWHIKISRQKVCESFSNDNGEWHLK